MKLTDEEKQLAEMIPNAGELREKVQTRIKTKLDDTLRQWLKHVVDKIHEAESKDYLVAQAEVPPDLVQPLSRLFAGRGYELHAAAYPRTNPPEHVTLTIKWETAELPPQQAPEAG